MTLPPAFVVVLTGGTARRLGGIDKTAVDVDGRPVLRRLLDEVGAVPVVVVGPRWDVGCDVLWTREDPPLGGPYAAAAAGVAAGLAAHPDAEVVVLLAGDQPFAGTAVPALRHALSCHADADAALAAGPDGRAQPLLAAYRLAAVRERLTGAVHDRPARELVRGLRTVPVPLDPRTTIDVDDPDDLAAARRLARGLSGPSGPAR